MSMNNHQSLWENNIRKYLKILQQRNIKLKKNNLWIRAKDTLLNEYNENEFEQIYHELWIQKLFSSEYHFHILMNILLDYYMLTHSSDQCAAEIFNLFIFEFKKEKFTCCMSLIFITCADKQNQHDQLKIIDALWYKKSLICILSELTFYLLCYWNIENESFSNFSI
jgi:hypothetical protein